MSGHWERDGEEFHNLEEMWDYIRENEDYFDEVDFEKWLNEHYLAAQIVWLSEDDDVKRYGSLWLWLQDEFENSEWIPSAQNDPEKGYDYHYGPCGEYEFEWVEDEEEDEL